jgi:starch synthase
MKALILSSEVAPFAKTGGLADVAGALPPCLQKQGCRTSVMMPYYRQVAHCKFDIRPAGKAVSVRVRDNTVPGEIYEGRINGAVPIYFIRQDKYYDRDGLYGTPTGDHHDNCERFVFFARAALEAVKALNLEPDIIHCNDWQTALVPAYLKTTHADDLKLAPAATLLTIHNLAYQGLFWHLDLPLIGLDWSYFTPKYLEFYGKINILKGGIIFSTLLNTVSRKYAEEIQTREYGCGLEGVLSDRKLDLYGVLNGVDYSEWSPEVDRLIPAHFSANDLTGKKRCKAELLKACNLPAGDDPLIGCISRLADQKGFDLIAKIIEQVMAMDLKMVILGTGEQRYHDLLTAIGKKYPNKISVNIKFDNKLAHMIEAGADMFLMPSRYEPCGLNQMYSLKYGTVPVVRSTGGLADTITDCTPATLQAGTANGFAFAEYDAQKLLETIKRAVLAFKDRDAWRRLMLDGMKQDWSWSRSAGEYVKLYEKAINQHAKMPK